MASSRPGDCVRWKWGQHWAYGRAPGVARVLGRGEVSAFLSHGAQKQYLALSATFNGAWGGTTLTLPARH